jgi:hypothetical protein
VNLLTRLCGCLVFGEIAKRCDNRLEIFLLERVGQISGIDNHAGKTEIIGTTLPGYVTDMGFSILCGLETVIHDIVYGDGRLDRGGIPFPE